MATRPSHENSQCFDEHQKASAETKEGVDAMKSDRKSIWKSLSTPESFRILRLHPGVESIQCTLREATFEDKPVYEALSYRCDDMTAANRPPSIITLDGIQVTVGPNLHAALKALRPADEPRDVWVDFLCIDQQQSGEKMQQITAMHRIYSAARRVVMWLGASSSDSDLAMASFPDLLAFLKQPHRFSYAEVYDAIKDGGKAPHWILDLESREIPAIRNLLGRSWFTRAWTLQEAALASEDSVLMCGDRELLYAHLKEFLERHLTDKTGLWDYATSLVTGAGKDTVIGYRHLKSVASLHRRLESPPRSVTEVFDTARYLDCTESCDRVFSLSRFVPSELLKRLTEIGMDEAKLYPEIAKSEVEIGNGAYVISAAGQWQQRSTGDVQNSSLWPSWVPDWKVSNQVKVLSQMTRVISHRHGKILYQATGQSSADMKVVSLDGGHALQTKGRFLGSIADCLESFTNDVPHLDDLGDAALTGSKVQQMAAKEDYLERSLQFARAKCRSSPYGDDVTTACLHTLVAGILLEEFPGFSERELPRPTDAELLQGLEESLFTYSHMREVVTIDQALKTGSPTAPDLRLRMERCVDNNPRFQALLERRGAGPTWFIEQMATACDGCRIFVSDKAYMGLAPGIALKGDALCLFPGCCAPLVLRPRDGRWSLIGECYVHGIMQGELLTEPVEEFFSDEIVLV